MIGISKWFKLKILNLGKKDVKKEVYFQWCDLPPLLPRKRPIKNCSICGVEIEVGDPVSPEHSTNRTLTKHESGVSTGITYYCEKCFNRLFQLRLAQLGGK